MDFTICLKKDMTIYVGGDPSKGMLPALTVDKVKNPQIVINNEKGTITVLEGE